MKGTSGIKKQTVCEKKRTGIRFLTVLGILLPVVTLSTWWLLKSSQKTTEAAVYNVSELYLEELAVQKAGQFTDTLNSQLKELSLTLQALQASDVASEEDLQRFIRQLKDKGSFDFFALSNSSDVFTEDGILPDMAETVFPDQTLTAPVISFKEQLNGQDLILICIPLEDRIRDTYGLTATAVGIDTDKVAGRLSLSEHTGRFFSNVITQDGDYIIRTHHAHLETDADLFSVLEREAHFQDEDAIRRCQEDLKADRSGMIVYELQNVLHYTCYMPIDGTDWFIMITLHYDLISQNIDIIRMTLTRNSAIQLILILIVLFTLFAVYLFMRRRNEDLRFEKMQAEESSKAKSMFLSSMSHDIRTPMNAIMGFTSLAMKNAEDPKRTRDYLAKILSSGDHLLALINDVLEMSRIESGKIHLEESPCSLLKILDELYCIIHGQAENQQLELSMDASGITDPFVYCDRLRLNQVFLNLLGNAVKFTPPGGRIFVQIEQAAHTADGYGTYTIRVRDTGIGMSPEFARKVFTPFERERTSTVSGIQGTGLGMSITKNIIDLMGGTIQVVTAPGEGTEFIIHLRLRLQEEQTESDPQAAPRETADPDEDLPDFTGRHILLVEDNDLNREIAQEILSEAGFQVDEAENGSIALEKLHAAAPGYYDLILMDIQMPVMDGHEAARTIRTLKEPALAATPIIAMTANAFEEDRQAALRAGMDHHLPKPLDVEQLFCLLSEILRK